VRLREAGEEQTIDLKTVNGTKLREAGGKTEAKYRIRINGTES